MTSNGTMANSSKKRKASELETDLNTQSPKPKQRGRPKSSKGSSKAVDEIPFTTQCPYQVSADEDDDVFVKREMIAPGFEFEFAIRPGQKWEKTRSYRNVKLQDHTFSVGTIIYVNKQLPPPPSPNPDATDEEILQYDRTNFWVGRIADTRAESDKAVYLRVYWLYWPEELPMGRQPYHGERELIQSNAMDIIDAQSISGAADLTHWDEKDSSDKYRERFWRQTFDISLLGKDRKGGLSELRKHCRCQQPDNPDKRMFECKKSSCLTWNHEACLLDDVMQRVWPVYQKEDNLDALQRDAIKSEEDEDDSIESEDDEDGQPEPSIRNKILSPVRSLGKLVRDKITPAVNTVIDQSIPHSVDGNTNGTSTSNKKNKLSKKPGRPKISKPWEGKLKVSIINTEEIEGDTPIIAKVEEVSNKDGKSEGRSWLIRVNCLVCGKVMH